MEYFRTNILSVDDEKRNIQSMKNSISHGRKKRSLEDEEYNDANFNLDDLENGEAEFVEPVLQTEPFNYQELVKWIQDTYPYYSQEGAHLGEKRFLGEFHILFG